MNNTKNYAMYDAKHYAMYKDTETCPKLKLKGLSTTRSVRSLIEESGGNVES